MTPAIVKKGLSGILHEGCLIHQLHSSTSAASVSFISLKPNTLLVYVHHAKVWAWPVHRRPWALGLALWLNRSLEGWLLILSSFYRYGSFWYPIISRPASPTLGPNCFILQNPSFEIRTYPSLSTSIPINRRRLFPRHSVQRIDQWSSTFFISWHA